MLLSQNLTVSVSYSSILIGCPSSLILLVKLSLIITNPYLLELSLRNGQSERQKWTERKTEMDRAKDRNLDSRPVIPLRPRASTD